MRKSNKKRLEHIRSIISKRIDPLSLPHIHPSAYIDWDITEIGKDHVIGPNVSIGWHGVGAELDENGNLIRFPQYGKIKIGNNVFIGANAVIDRATDDNNLTEIGDRSIIGPKAHICHNVKIGEDTLILGDAIVTGGAIIGKRCMIGANSTVRNKVKVGDDVIVGMGSVVTKDVPNGATVKGNPAK